ncbi:MAG: EamA family transporter [Candidatus Geothermarchaeales archaeon]
MVNELVLALLTSVSWGLSAIFIKKGLAYTKPLVGLTIALITGVASMLVYNAMTGQISQLTKLSMRQALFFVGAGMVGLTLALIFYYSGLERGDISRVMPIAYSSPLFAMFFSALLLGEELRLSALLGTILIIMGIWLVARS